jgi:hypothetical protein
MEDGAGVATLVQEVPIHVQVESAERQTIPLFKVKRPAQLAKHARPPDETRRLGGGHRRWAKLSASRWGSSSGWLARTARCI